MAPSPPAAVVATTTAGDDVTRRPSPRAREHTGVDINAHSAVISSVKVSLEIFAVLFCFQSVTEGIADVISVCV